MNRKAELVQAVISLVVSTLLVFKHYDSIWCRSFLADGEAVKAADRGRISAILTDQ